MPNVLSTISGTLYSCATCTTPQSQVQDNKGNFANLRNLADRTDVILGVSDTLHKYGLGFLINGRLERHRVVRCDKLDPDSIFLKEHYASGEFRNAL